MARYSNPDDDDRVGRYIRDRLFGDVDDLLGRTFRVRVEGAPGADPRIADFVEEVLNDQAERDATWAVCLGCGLSRPPVAVWPDFALFDACDCGHPQEPEPNPGDAPEPGPAPPPPWTRDWLYRQTLHNPEAVIRTTGF